MSEETKELQEEYLDVETVVIPTEDGEIECAILDYFSFEGKKYAIVSPIEDDVITEQVEIFRYKENGEKVTLDAVTDKKQFNRIAEAYNKQ